MTDQKHTKESSNDESKAIEILDSMAETWVEKYGMAEAIRSIPVNCPTLEFQDRAYGLIMRHVKQAYVVGLYTGRTSATDQLTSVTKQRDELREALELASDILSDFPNDENDIQWDVDCRKIRDILAKTKGDV